MTNGSLDAADVRRLLRLLGELRELGKTPALWRRHLVQSLEMICGGRAALAGELAVVGPVHDRSSLRPIHFELQGIPAARTGRFFEEVVWESHGPNDVITGAWARFSDRFTVTRRDVADDRRWYSSPLANEQFRSFDCDDFLVSMVPVPSLEVLAGIKVFRSWRDRPFSEREVLFVELLSEELDRDWSQVTRAQGGPALGRRLRQVLTLLSTGATEKEIASALGVSPYTVHDYTKALYRALGVHSRTELLARTKRPAAVRTHLISEPSEA